MGLSKVRYEDIVAHPEVYGTTLPLWANELAAKGYEGICAIDFYDDIFLDDLAEQRTPEEYITGEYCGIAVERILKVDDNGDPILDDKGSKQWIGRRIQITQGNMELYDLIDKSDNFCIVAPFSYAGRNRTNKNARFMYALCIEVDDIKPNGGLDELIYSWERKNMPVPKPTYIVCSGNGLHLYYVFEKPIPMWQNIFESVSAYKKHITPWLWTKFITKSYDDIEYESINQPFRVVGTRTKDNGYALAFSVGDKVSIEYMNKFVPADKAMTSVYKSKCSLEEAQRLYPEWYKRRIVKGEPRKCWTRYEGIYHNWIEKILNGAKVGRRYNCLENLCSLAVQCNIAPEQVEADCRRVAEYLETLTIKEDNHFTEHDILCALKTYHKAEEGAFRRKIDYISKKTGIPLEPNPRNGRSQKDHLRAEFWIDPVTKRRKINFCKQNRELALQDLREAGEIHGRPKGSGTKKEIVEKWQAAHPGGKKIDCEKETGLSRHTVLKWWK